MSLTLSAPLSPVRALHELGLNALCNEIGANLVRGTNEIGDDMILKLIRDRYAVEIRLRPEIRLKGPSASEVSALAPAVGRLIQKMHRSQTAADSQQGASAVRKNEESSQREV
jgi:HAMP domain-containing protein